jgi:CheY-like chemotaxis protein
MISTILHLEEDADHRELVRLLFESFGFRGKHVSAATLAAAIKVLEDTSREGGTLDLVVSGMHLPDGTGLDLIRYVRASPAWKTTPMMILSGDVDPAQAEEAYALGADAYVSKASPGRLLADVVTALYAHWANDAVATPGLPPSRIEQFLARASNHRGRHARVYQRIAEKFAKRSPPEAAFWLSLALSELNATSLLACLQRAISDSDIPELFVEKMDRGADVVEARLSAIEQQLDQGEMTRDRAYRTIISLLSAMSLEGLTLSIDHLFSGMPLPMAAARDFLVNLIGDVARWIDANTDDAALREQAEQLLAAASATLARVAAPTAITPPAM